MKKILKNMKENWIDIIEAILVSFYIITEGGRQIYLNHHLSFRYITFSIIIIFVFVARRFLRGSEKIPRFIKYLRDNLADILYYIGVSEVILLYILYVVCYLYENHLFRIDYILFAIFMVTLAIDDAYFSE